MTIFVQKLASIFFLLPGLIFLAVSDPLKNLGVPQWASMLSLFVIYNLILAWQLKLVNRLQSVWSYRKIHHFIFGFLIGLIPIGTAIGWMFLQGTINGPSADHLSISSLLITLAIVTWEELWFRGIVLDFAASKYSEFGTAAVFGALFVALHLLNPEIQIIRDGPELFLAGYSLSVCYFVFQSIWAPIGMHFANNFMESSFGLSTEPNGPAYLIPLFVVSVVLTFFLRCLLVNTNLSNQSHSFNQP